MRKQYELFSVKEDPISRKVHNKFNLEYFVHSLKKSPSLQNRPSPSCHNFQERRKSDTVQSNGCGKSRLNVCK